MQPPAIEIAETGHVRTTKSLQEVLDVASSELKEWTTVLPFLMRDLPANPGAVPGYTCITPDSHCDNLLQYLHPINTGYKIYFSAKHNSKGMSFGAGDKGWKELLNDIEIAGSLQGFYPVSNGGDRGRRDIVCRTFRKYQGTKQHHHSPSKQEYRSKSLHSDRKNSRGNTGKKVCGKSRTMRALGNDSLCHFGFAIKVDNVDFYLVGGKGSATHCHHPKMTACEYALPMRLIVLMRRTFLLPQWDVLRQMMGSEETFISLAVAM